jgi:hypothetical protein
MLRTVIDYQFVRRRWSGDVSSSAQRSAHAILSFFRLYRPVSNHRQIVPETAAKAIESLIFRPLLPGR